MAFLKNLPEKLSRFPAPLKGGVGNSGKPETPEKDVFGKFGNNTKGAHRMENTTRAAELMGRHIANCKEMFELMCIELQNDPDTGMALMKAIGDGVITLQIVTSFDGFPVIQGIGVDQSGGKFEIFRLNVETPRLHDA